MVPANWIDVIHEDVIFMAPNCLLTTIAYYSQEKSYSKQYLVKLSRESTTGGFLPSWKPLMDIGLHLI